MMNLPINERQNKYIGLLFTGFIALGGLAAFLSYRESAKHSKIKEEILNLDKAIKELELHQKINGSKK